MKVLLTGAAGFIGSCILRTLNDIGVDDIIIVDDVGVSEKWLNLSNKRWTEYIHKSQLADRMADIEPTHIVHMGACSSTTETDFDYLYKNNYEYSKMLWEYADQRNIPFIYASSAATYGDGSVGFDDHIDIDNLLPLNRYGYSKQLFDRWVQRQTHTPPQFVGLKFFNVFGPNEYAKGSMASMVYHGFHQIMESGEIRLFKSYKENTADGDQRRDFIYVKDVCSVVRFFLKNPHISGLFNVGTGVAHSFRELAEATFLALGMEPNICFIDMPETLRDKYQYFTEAKMSKLYGIGYDKPFIPLADSVTDYVRGYLLQNKRIY